MDHYFEASPTTASDTKAVTIDLVDPPLRLLTDRGVFSHGRIDAGTEFLLRQAPPPPTSGVFLDLGCGAGAIALTMARRSPAARVIAVDVNERAVALCARNAASNGLARVDAVTPDDVDASARFDLIWSNPPIRIGKAPLHALLEQWLGRLAPDASAVLVVHKHLGSDSLQRWLADHGWPTSRIASSRGYRLLRVARSPAGPRRSGIRSASEPP
jgi:16S rRNA (guanine1207-N2)-methyltransferase